MDGHQWPAGPGPQHPGEPPRIVTERVPNRAARLKALGNAIVPQQIFPIFKAIVEEEVS
jgi:DNA (cytosine-5)-methyltransferase 1